MDKPNVVDAAIAPLKWLERARGWRRRALLLAYILIAMVVGIFGWRELNLWRLPNAPEPFELKKYGRVEVVEADNAMPLYRVAGGRIKDAQSWTIYKPTAAKPWDETDFTKADPEVLRWAEDSRAALEPWLMAVDKPEALIWQPEELTISSPLNSAQAVREASTLALLEGSRLEGAGDLAGAWRMYRGVLRSSRHVGRHGPAIQRLVGHSVLKRSVARVNPWIDEPGNTSALLRRAIADVEACRAMTAPASETIRAEYFTAKHALSHPELWRQFEIDEPSGDFDWVHQFEVYPAARRFLRRDPERSLRVLRLVVAGHLAQADRPTAARPKLVSREFMIYDHDARTPPIVRTISPEALEAWARDSALMGLGYSFGIVQPMIDAEVGVLDSIRLRMAERAYRLDQDRPPRTFSELLGPYLKTLPEGIEPTDPVGGAPEVVEQ